MRSTNSLLTLLSLAACLLFVFGISVNAAPAPELEALTDALQGIKSSPSDNNEKHISTTPKGQPAAKDYGFGGNRDVYWKKSNEEAHLEQRSPAAKSSHKAATSHKKHSKSSKKADAAKKKMQKIKSSAGGEAAKKPAAQKGSTASGAQPAGDWGFAGGWGTYY